MAVGPSVDGHGSTRPGPQPLSGVLPARLRAAVETASGLPMDDVRVHRNSARPARIGALAYAQGRDIHLGPRQERHLPHEAWHVVQQKQGRVHATTQAGGRAVNDDAGLEREADAMGDRMLGHHAGPRDTAVRTERAPIGSGPLQRRKIDTLDGVVVTEDHTRTSLQEMIEWSDDENFKAAVQAAIDAGEFCSDAAEKTAPPDGLARIGNIWKPASAAPEQVPGQAAPRLPLSDIRNNNLNALKKTHHASAIIDYRGPTVGVEQEIVNGYRIKCFDARKRPSSGGIIGDVTEGSDILLYFTTDMGSEGEYTIELKTTPCVGDDAAALRRRHEATRIMVAAIIGAGRSNAAVQSASLGGLSINIRAHGHRIVKDGDDIAYGNQATLGFRTSDLRLAETRQKLMLGDSSWLDPRYDRDELGTLADPSARNVYALLASAIAKVARLISDQAHPFDEHGELTVPLTDPKIKNSWDTLPRTSPWRWLDGLSRQDRDVIAQQLEKNFDATEIGRFALEYIRSGKPLGGHPIPEFTIGGQPAAAFEVRNPGSGLNGYFYNGDGM